MANCVDCSRSRVQFPEYGSGMPFLRCTVSGWQCSAERRSGECGPSGRFFTATVPLVSEQSSHYSQQEPKP